MHDFVLCLAMAGAAGSRQRLASCSTNRLALIKEKCCALAVLPQELYIYNSAEGIESVSLDGVPLMRDP